MQRFLSFLSSRLRSHVCAGMRRHKKPFASAVLSLSRNFHREVHFFFFIIIFSQPKLYQIPTIFFRGYHAPSVRACGGLLEPFSKGHRASDGLQVTSRLFIAGPRRETQNNRSSSLPRPIWASRFASRAKFLDCGRKPEVPGENPSTQRENMQTSLREPSPRDSIHKLLAVRRQC